MLVINISLNYFTVAAEEKGFKSHYGRYTTWGTTNHN